MSFSGGAGHKSPFAERAKSTKSHLSPRRSSTASGTNPRPAQQSLFGKESSGDSSAKVAQFRSEVKEPTTPTRLSEGGVQKGNRRDEFSSFNSRRIGTPIKTPRTAFGSIPPRSPKRPYVGSPKYQKVLLERPAFYNTPGVEPAAVEPERKEVTISELQKRLKRFLQDENGSSTLQVTAATDNLEDVPYNISRSPRVNPLFHHDETVLQVAKGGVAFTAGVSDTTGVHTRPGGVAFTAGADFVVCSHTRPVCLFKEESSAPLPQSGTNAASPDAQDEPASSTDAADEPASGTDTTSPDAQDEHVPGTDTTSPDAQDEPASGSETDAQDEPASSIGTASPNAQCSSHEEGLELEQSLHSGDFPVHTEVEDGCQVEEGATEDVEHALESEDKTVASLTSPIVEVQESVGAIETLDAYDEEEEIEVILESWTQRFLKFVVLAVMVTCVMGMMVLASGSQGLLPHNLHSQPRLFGSSPLIPVSIGFMGHGRKHEGLQCLPAVHFRSKNLPSTSSHGAISLEPPTTVARMDSEVADIDNDELKTVIDYYKELQGRLFSDVAALSGAWDSEIGLEYVIESEIVDGVVGEDQTEVDAREDDSKSQDVTEIVNATAEEPQLEVPLSSSEEAQIAEDLPITLDTISEFESHQLPADEEPTTSIVTLEPSSSVSEDTETDPDLKEFSMEEAAFNNIPAALDAELGQLEVTPTVENLAEFPVQETDEDVILSSIVNINEVPEVEYVILHEEDPQSQDDSTVKVSYDSPTSNVEEVALLKEESAEGLVEEVALLEEESPKGLVDEAHFLEEESSKVLVEEVATLEEDSAAEGLDSPLTSIGLVVAAMTSIGLVVALLLKLLKRAPKPTVTLATAIQSETAAERKSAFPAAELKSMSSPVAKSVYSTHNISDRVEFDAISSPLRTQRNIYSLRAAAEPALSAPGLFQPRASPAAKPATTWHPAMRAGSNTISSSGYRQTASYVPTFPTESSISTSTRGASDTDSVCESALTMGADEWEHLGSFTTTELVSVNEGGEDHKIRTPVRRSQRIRNRVSPLPLNYN